MLYVLYVARISTGILINALLSPLYGSRVDLSGSNLLIVFKSGSDPPVLEILTLLLNLSCPGLMFFTPTVNLSLLFLFSVLVNIGQYMRKS